MINAEKKTLSKKDFWKATGIVAGSFGLAACIPEDNALPTASELDKEPFAETTHRFPTLEEVLTTGGYPTLAYKPSTGPATLSTSIPTTRFTNPNIPKNVPTPALPDHLQAAYSKPNEAGSILQGSKENKTLGEQYFCKKVVEDNFSGILFIGNEDKGQCVLPGSPRAFEISRDLALCINPSITDEEKSSALDGLHELIYANPDNEDESIRLLASLAPYLTEGGYTWFTTNAETLRNEIGELPDNLTPDDMLCIWQAMIYQQSCPPDVREQLIKFAKETHTSHGIYIPSTKAIIPEDLESNEVRYKKLVEQFQAKLETVRNETFYEIPNRPDVHLLFKKKKDGTFKYELHVDYGGKIMESGHPKRIIPLDDFVNWIDPQEWDQVLGEEFNRVKENAADTAQFDIKSRIFGYVEPTEIYKLKSECIRAFLEPNKLLGTQNGKSKNRIVYGIYSKNSDRWSRRSPLSNDVLFFGTDVIDYLFHQRPQIPLGDMFTWFQCNHWITDITDHLKNLKNAGVSKIDKNFLMSPKQWLLNMLYRGTLDEAGQPKQSLDPLDPVLKDIALSTLLQAAQNVEEATERIKKATILNCTKETDLYDISFRYSSHTYYALQLATLLSTGGNIVLPDRSEPATVKPMVDQDGRQVKLVPGDNFIGLGILPFEIEGSMVDHLICVRYDGPTENWDQDKVEVIGVRVEDALHNIIPVDPDDHIKQGIELTFQIIATIAISRGMLKNPAGTGEFVTEFLKMFKPNEASKMPYLIIKFLFSHGLNKFPSLVKMRQYIYGK